MIDINMTNNKLRKLLFLVIMAIIYLICGSSVFAQGSSQAGGMAGAPLKPGDCGPKCRFVGSHSVIRFDDLHLVSRGGAVLIGIGQKTLGGGGKLQSAYYTNFGVTYSSGVDIGKTPIQRHCVIDGHASALQGIWLVDPLNRQRDHEDDLRSFGIGLSMETQSACSIEKDCTDDPNGNMAAWSCRFQSPSVAPGTTHLNTHTALEKLGRDVVVENVWHGAFSQNSNPNDRLDIFFRSNKSHTFGRLAPPPIGLQQQPQFGLYNTIKIGLRDNIIALVCSGPYCYSADEEFSRTDNAIVFAYMSEYQSGPSVHVYGWDGANPGSGNSFHVCMNDGPPGSGCESLPTSSPTITPSPTMTPSPTFVPCNQFIGTPPPIHKYTLSGCLSDMDPINYVIEHSSPPPPGTVWSDFALAGWNFVFGSPQEINIRNRCQATEQNDLEIGLPLFPPFPLTEIQFHTRHITNCTWSTGNAHFEKVGLSGGCPPPGSTGFPGVWHVILPDGYVLGRMLAVSDLLASGNYQLIRQEDWGNEAHSPQCDGTSVSGDGIVTFLARQ